MNLKPKKKKTPMETGSRKRKAKTKFGKIRYLVIPQKDSGRNQDESPNVGHWRKVIFVNRFRNIVIIQLNQPQANVVEMSRRAHLLINTVPAGVDA